MNSNPGTRTMKEPTIHCSVSLGPSSIPKPSASVPNSSLLHSTESLPPCNPCQPRDGGQPQGNMEGDVEPWPCKACGFLLAFPRAKSLPWLSNSLKGQKKRKGPEMTGVGSTLPGYEQRAPPDCQPRRWQSPRSMPWKEQQGSRGVHSPALQ